MRRTARRPLMIATVQLAPCLKLTGPGSTSADIVRGSRGTARVPAGTSPARLTRMIRKAMGSRSAPPREE